ncbi:MAG: PQQ-dependent sugar dehydrogenase [Xanthomonadales bacterium]|nr:PQQ-dependent sugar dehydrogenase [Xanthomonadales bacterium]
MTTPIAFVDPDDGSSRRLIATQQGAILVWDGASSQILPTPFLDLRDDVGGPVLAQNERGLLALVVAPDYASSGRLYVMYTRADLGPGTLGDVVIARYQRSAGNPALGSVASAENILVIEHSSASNHNGGWLAFGPDGFLYIATGDGGGGCDSGAGANGDGQHNDSLAGKMLRIDVHGVDASGTAPDDCGVGVGNYTIPTSNPFAGQEPACDEIWATGLRNPFRFSFDRQSGDLFIGDVGQSKWEEINIIPSTAPAPVNFGWVCREGCESAGNAESSCPVSGCPLDAGTSCEFPRASGFFDPPLCHRNFNHSDGFRSIIGGYRYRGSRIPSIAGDYFYSDAYCGQVWKTDMLDTANPAAISSSCWASGYGGSYGFAEDHLGELYLILGAAGRIDCIHNGGGCSWAGQGDTLFADGFEGP